MNYEIHLLSGKSIYMESSTNLAQEFVEVIQERASGWTIDKTITLQVNHIVYIKQIPEKAVQPCE